MTLHILPTESTTVQNSKFLSTMVNELRVLKRSKKEKKMKMNNVNPLLAMYFF